jgi:lipopolysaccharide transport system ATP-binding protein
LTGRENIYLNGAILGMGRAEIARKFDEIVAFAEVEKFLDTPVKRYSSGMYVRLAFAVAAHLEPEILIVDEVLAVGDAQFQKKCLGKMEDIAENEGRTILFVSHSMAAVKMLCSKGIVLNAGSVLFQGTAADCCEKYMTEKTETANNISTHIKKIDPSIAIDSITINGSESDQIRLANDMDCFEISVNGDLRESKRIALEVQITDSYGSPVAFFCPSHDRGEVTSYQAGDFCIRENMILPRMMKGIYYLNIYMTEPNVSGWVDIPSAVRVDCDGTATALGQTFDYAAKGWILLSDDRHIRAKNNPSKVDFLLER